MFRIPSPGRSVTRARRLYVSRLANFRVSDPRYGAEHRTFSAIVSVKGCALSAKPSTGGFRVRSRQLSQDSNRTFEISSAAKDGKAP